MSIVTEIENPLVKGDSGPTYLVKRKEKDKKGRFSLFELELKPGVGPNNLAIKKLADHRLILAMLRS